ncbi:MAG: hypothetical protein HYY20_06000 [Candidatus Tectomicrobia bacterium]|uniref:Lipoprotein SmpA/OmlA domain-containing protein n=1 Tax=Tectimicrobiota bacterium TaxID=2528274 RepID=A0A932G0K7_UNCTE|nr:hypothetical protein [Candidatus Tectomicrobia bacterium]
MARETFSRIAVTGLPGLLILISTLAACTTLQVRAGGKRPNPEVLEKTLRPGESTPADVLAALGEPDGKGREMLPVGRTPRTLWSYYYEEGSLENMGLVINKLKDSRRIFLFVFFDQDRYDGYMWFSSLPK